MNVRDYGRVNLASLLEGCVISLRWFLDNIEQVIVWKKCIFCNDKITFLMFENFLLSLM